MHLDETQPQRGRGLYIINSNFQRHIWSHCYLLYLPLFSGDLVIPINRLISKIFNSFQGALFLITADAPDPLSRAIKHLGCLSVICSARQMPMCQPIGRHGIIQWIINSEKYFIGSKHTLRKDSWSLHNTQRVSLTPGR